MYIIKQTRTANFYLQKNERFSNSSADQVALGNAVKIYLNKIEQSTNGSLIFSTYVHIKSKITACNGNISLPTFRKRMQTDMLQKLRLHKETLKLHNILRNHSNLSCYFQFLVPKKMSKHNGKINS